MYGYFRDIEKEIMLNTIPDSLATICLRYYGIMDYFSISGKDTTISSDGMIASKMDNVENGYDNTSYGSKWIASNQNAII